MDFAMMIAMKDRGARPGISDGRRPWRAILVAAWIVSMGWGALLSGQEAEVKESEVNREATEPATSEVIGSGEAAERPVSEVEEEREEDVSSPPVAEESEEVTYNELLIVVGAEGEAEYGEVFESNAELWRQAAGEGKVKVSTIGAANEDPLGDLESYLAEADKSMATPLWIVFIGHGTYDKREAYFNLAGPDLSAKDLRQWVEPFERPLIVLNTASSSGTFLPMISGSNRMVITATKSGTEVNFASFGSYLARALLEPEADLNNDGENSLFELFSYAARQTADFYEQEGRVQTETPLLDDNGDGRGTSFEALMALREGGTASQEPDGAFAKRWALVLSPEEQAIPPQMRQKRNVLESQIEALRPRREDLGEEAYYERLEALASQIAELYAGLEGWSPIEEDDAENETPESTGEPPISPENEDESAPRIRVPVPDDGGEASASLEDTP